MKQQRPDLDLIKKTMGLSALTVNWLAGDGSDRCYFRLTSPDLPSPLVIMMLAESEYHLLHEDKYEWLSSKIS